MTNTVTVDYFAVVDPTDRGRIVYFRLSGRGLLSWPPEAKCGPPSTDDPLADIASRLAWNSRVLASIAAAPLIAAARFATFKIRCASCARPLREPASVAYGIGPECRSGLPPEVLAALSAEVGRFHAARGDLVPMTFDLFQPQPEGARS